LGWQGPRALLLAATLAGALDSLNLPGEMVDISSVADGLCDRMVQHAGGDTQRGHGSWLCNCNPNAVLYI
jgi:hypothetical protein